MDLQADRVEVRTDFAALLPPVRGDGVQLQQVTLNLARIACDAMKRVDDRPRHLLVRTQVPGDNCVHLSVCDAGATFRFAIPIGMAAGQLARAETSLA